MTLVILTGRSATGKTALAEALAKKMEAEIVSTDKVRVEIFKKYEFPEGEREKVASAVYGKVFERAKKALAQGKGVILDGTFFSSALRTEARKLAPDNFLVLVKCSPEKAQERRFKKGLPKEVYEEPEDADVVVDSGSASPEECAEKVIAAIKK